MSLPSTPGGRSQATSSLWGTSPLAPPGKALLLQCSDSWRSPLAAGCSEASSSGDDAGEAPAAVSPREVGKQQGGAQEEAAETVFPNGTVRRRWPDGAAVTAFTNGDLKQELPSGIIEYYFREVDCWQVTHPSSGVEVFYHAGGRAEAHLPNGAKETLMPAGAGAAASRTLPGGERTLAVPPPLLCREIMEPRPVALRRGAAA